MSDIQLNNRFNEIFENTPILGMIHLAEKTKLERLERALEEVVIYEEEGVDGVIVEDYHGDIFDVKRLLFILDELKPGLKVGVNILDREDFNDDISFDISKNHDVDFVQLDIVGGETLARDLDFEAYKKGKELCPDILVLGGVWFKYKPPAPNSVLQKDIKQGKERAEVIVTTGKGTGSETPIEKLVTFKEIMGKHPLFVGAGLDKDNVVEQLKVADGGIVGSCFKPNKDTTKKVDRELVRKFMEKVNEVRDYKKSLN